MKTIRWLGAMAVAGAISAPAAPFDAGLVPDKAAWVLHADLDAFKGTQVGALILSELQKPEAENKMAALQAMFNFDPRKDLGGMTAYGTDASEKNGVVVFEGRFDSQRLTTLAKANDGYASDIHAGDVVHSWTEKEKKGDRKGTEGAEAAGGKQVFASIVDNRLMVIGQEASAVKGALDVVRRRQSGLLPNSPLAALLNSQPGSFVAAGADFSRMADAKRQSAVLQGAGGGSLQLGEANGQMTLSCWMQAASPDKAAQIQMIVQGMIALAALDEKANPELVKLARGTQCQVQDETVKISLSYPAADIVNSMRKEMEREKAREQKKKASAAPAT